MRTNSQPARDLAVTLRRDDPVALHRQLEAALRAQIRAGRLREGTALPATRVLAGDLGVSRGVVVEAYEQLVAEGYLTSHSGGYTRVAAGGTADRAGRTASPSKERTVVAAPKGSAPSPVDFGYGRANVSTFPRTAWLRSVRRVLSQAPDDRLAYLDGRGVPELRAALADYLNRVRGTAASPENIVIANGYAQGIALLLGVLARSGARRLAVEDPSADDDARPIAETLGLELVGVPVGRDGLREAALDDLRADALILTPSHQWPTGAVLSAQARGAVLRWAQREDALIVEDDYDAEYRYDRAPIGAMQGLAPDQVVYAGTASKTLAPGLRLGWFVLPPHLVDAFEEAKVLADRGSPVLDQLTFANFLEHGEFDRHLRRMRPVYRGRRDALLRALREQAPDLVPAGVAAGLHLATWLPADLDEDAVVAAAARHGVAVHGLASYRLAPSAEQGLIFGYATATDREIAAGVQRLAAAIAEVRGA